MDVKVDVLGELQQSYIEAVIKGDVKSASRVVDHGLAAGVLPSKLRPC